MIPLSPFEEIAKGVVLESLYCDYKRAIANVFPTPMPRTYFVNSSLLDEVMLMYFGEHWHSGWRGVVWH